VDARSRAGSAPDGKLAVRRRCPASPALVEGHDPDNVTHGVQTSDRAVCAKSPSPATAIAAATFQEDSTVNGCRANPSIEGTLNTRGSTRSNAFAGECVKRVAREEAPRTAGGQGQRARRRRHRKTSRERQLDGVEPDGAGPQPRRKGDGGWANGDLAKKITVEVTRRNLE